MVKEGYFRLLRHSRKTIWWKVRPVSQWWEGLEWQRKNSYAWNNSNECSLPFGHVHLLLSPLFFLVAQGEKLKKYSFVFLDREIQKEEATCREKIKSTWLKHHELVWVHVWLIALGILESRRNKARESLIPTRKALFLWIYYFCWQEERAYNIQFHLELAYIYKVLLCYFSAA